jgi:hypothetical protein
MRRITLLSVTAVALSVCLSCRTLDPGGAGVLAGVFLPAGAEVTLYADLTADNDWRGALADLAGAGDRAAASVMLERCDLVWGAVTSISPFKGVFVLYGRYGYGHLKFLLSGRDEWLAEGADGFRHRDRPLFIRVPTGDLLVVYAGYEAGDIPPGGDTVPAGGEVIRIKGSPPMPLPVRELDFSFIRESGRYRMSGFIVPEEGKGPVLLPAFKGFLTFWARNGGDDLFTNSYRASRMVLDSGGNVVLDELYFSEPLPFLMELIVPGEKKQ